MKKKPALIAAFLTTLVIAIAMILVGLGALLNPDSVAVASAPAAASNASSADPAAVNTSAADQVKQLQDLISQYQQREQQYQQQEQQLQNQLNQASSQAQQYQSILNQLQQMGVIQISSNGQISVPRRLR